MLHSGASTWNWRCTLVKTWNWRCTLVNDLELTLHSGVSTWNWRFTSSEDLGLTLHIGSIWVMGESAESWVNQLSHGKKRRVLRNMQLNKCWVDFNGGFRWYEPSLWKSVKLYAAYESRLEQRIWSRIAAFDSWRDRWLALKFSERSSGFRLVSPSMKHIFVSSALLIIKDGRIYTHKYKCIYIFMDINTVVFTK